MSKRITNRISLSSIVALSFLGVAANECLAGGSDCTANATFNVCVAWNQGDDPVEGSDYKVTFHGTDAPDLELLKGDSGWIVYCEEFSNPGTPADIGVFTTPGGDADYTVTIKNGSLAGFKNVGSMSLVPAGDKFSSIASGSKIDGDIDGLLKLVTDPSGDGGELGGLIVIGDVEGPVTIPKATGALNIIHGAVTLDVTIGEITDGGFTIVGAIAGNVTVTTISNGQLKIDGSVPSTSTITVNALSDSSPTVQTKVDLGRGPQATFQGRLVLGTGLPDPETYVFVSRFFPEAEIDLTGDPVGGSLIIIGDGLGDIVNGGAVSGTVILALDTGFGEAAVGSATFASITSTGVVQTAGGGGASLGGPLTIMQDMDGLISIVNQLRNDGEISVGGTTRGDIVIGGDIFNGSDITLSGGLEGGTLTVVGHVVGPPFGGSVISIADMISDGGGNPSSIDFQQDFGGTLDLPMGIKASQEVRIGGEFTSVNSINLNSQGVAGTLEIVGGGCGSIDNGGAARGTVILADGATKSYTGSAAFASILSGGVIKTLNGADLGGDLSISGNVGGDVSVSGDMTSASSVTVGGKLAAGLSGAGRILVTGLCSGDISIGQETASATLIHLLEGLDSGASLVINADEGNFNANGDIHVGVISCAFSPLDVIYDGCIRIHDEDTTGNTGDYGNLNGELQICGCHNEGDLNVCPDGDDNGNVTISQGDCTNQVGWSCGGCP